MAEKKRLEDMSVEELKEELDFTHECLLDEEKTFDFMFKVPQHLSFSLPLLTGESPLV
ncbi:MAG: hypothetical protein HGA78_02245 [Nitrospirales bacterium]|nr:hypothetical protein [Nitrospirales bacterium]